MKALAIVMVLLSGVLGMTIAAASMPAALGFMGGLAYGGALACVAFVGLGARP